MASTAELEAQILAEMETNPDAFADGPVDDVLNIDAESKTIDLPLSESLFGVEGEKDVERKYFRCPKIVGDNIDLSTHQIYVHYATATTKTGGFDTNKMTGAYHCDDVEIDETGSYITFSWVLSDNALSQPGFVGFAVFAKYSEGEELKTKWKTQPAIGTVAMTVPDGEVIVEKYPDVINQIFTKLAEIEKGSVSDEAVAAAVADYMAANPVEGTADAVQYVAQTLTEEQQTQARANIGAASSAEVGKLSATIDDLEEDMKNVGNPTDEQISSAVSEYLEENPIETGAPVIYPIQRSAYYDDLTKQIQKKANEATLLSTENHLAHSIKGSADNTFLCLTWNENNVENDKSTDTSDSSGKVHQKCKIVSSYYGILWNLKNENKEYIVTDTFDAFPYGTEVFDTSGNSLGTIVASSDGIATKDYVNDNAAGRFVLSALCQMSDGNKIAVSRTVTTKHNATRTISYTMSDITPFTLTIDGVSGANLLSRIDSSFPETIGYSSCGYAYNGADNKFYIAPTITGKGVAILSTTDFVNHTYVAFYEYDKAHLECSLFFDSSWISQTYKSGMFLACRSQYGHEFVRLAKLDYTNNFAVMDEVDIPATTSKPLFTSSFLQTTYNGCYLVVSDYNRNRASIYQIMQKNIRQLRPIAVIDEKCCNYTALINIASAKTDALNGHFIICGTNGEGTNLKGVSAFYENLKYGYYEFSGELYELPTATEDTLGGVKPVSKTDEMTQKVGVDEDGALWTKESKTYGSSNGGTYAETQLYSGSLGIDYVNGTVISTGVTLSKLREYKMFAIRFKGTSDTALNNTRLILNGSKSSNTTLDLIATSGYEAVFEWVDSEKTVLRPVQIYSGQAKNASDIGTNFIRQSSAGNRLATGSGTMSQVFGWCLINDFADTDELTIVSYSIPTIDYNWEIRGLIK